MNAKNIAFIIMMGALGTALFGVTYYLGPIAPGVNLDFSLIGGFIVKGLKIGQKPRTSLITVPATFLAYVPESIMTYVYFIVVLGSQAGAATFFTAILPKAIVEVAIISVIMAALGGKQ